jgi:hypothetical protein
MAIATLSPLISDVGGTMGSIVVNNSNGTNNIKPLSSSNHDSQSFPRRSYPKSYWEKIEDSSWHRFWHRFRETPYVRSSIWQWNVEHFKVNPDSLFNKYKQRTN